MQELEKILEEIDAIKTGFDTECRSECDLYDWSCGACVGECDEYIKERAKEIICKHMNDGWIPVDRELPPNAKHEGAFCPKYQVMTKYGVTEGWYNPDAEGWYVLIWFMTDRYLESEIDFDKGDKPKIVFIPDEVNSERNILIAWKEMGLYRTERSEE